MKGLDALPPKVIGRASKETDKITETRIRQVINDGRQQIQKTAPQIIQGAIENVYKTPFRLLRNLGKKICSTQEKNWNQVNNKNE